MTPANLTAAEKNFILRMAYHVKQGESFDDAARAVLADDERIWIAFCDRGTSQYVPTPDERGLSHYTGQRPGDLMISELTKSVYERLKK